MRYTEFFNYSQIRCSLLPTPRSAAPYSLLPIPYSQIRCSLFPIPHFAKY
ncbi:hypothetical protein BJP36_39095 [Moorena producens JHB]|uniref:Uncharacterized protein n=1 Tax=Moorena producens (strain JHB) TaxID=1454205 RepID=A0A9Q9SUV4_MOOP1|nr:hypothetical protein [Moorena producens]WAN70073.1 hypothetical protein BJP36_39095 [Moorena producens JHB]